MKTQVRVPFDRKEDEMIFEKIEITADCNERTCKDVEDFVSLHYSLKSVCIVGDVDD